MAEYLTDLVKGARACLDNADRLIEDSEILFYENSFLSCFVLVQLALEELAKGFLLIKKQSRNKKFSKEDWKRLKEKSKAHKMKLTISEDALDQWTAEVVRP